MESNKLMIGVQFIDSEGLEKFIELIVLRDATLKQLFDGIRYGLEKKSSDPTYNICKNIFLHCIAQMENNVFRCVTLTSYNQAVRVRTMELGDGRNRVVLSTDDLQKQIEEIGFISSTRIVFDWNGDYDSIKLTTSAVIPAFNPDYQQEKIFPDYNISTRQLDKFDDTPVEIIAPSEMPQEQNQSLFFMMLPTILMMGVMILVRGVFMNNNGSGMSMILLSVSMSAVTMVTSIINRFRQKKEYKAKLKTWREQYEGYIDKLIEEVNLRKEGDVKKLDKLYPDVNYRLNADKISENIYSICSAIFSRSYADRDFLTVRLGVSNQVENMFEIKGSEKDAVFSAVNFKITDDKVTIFIPSDKEYLEIDDKHFYLTNLPSYVAKEYQYMKNAPLLFSVKNCASLGIVSPSMDMLFYMIERMIFDLCFYHAPEDLQFVILFPHTKDWDEQEMYVQSYKFLPHFHGFLQNRAQFVFDMESANAVFGIMLNIMAERAENKSGRSLPHIVMVVYEEYGLKEHAFAQYLPEVPQEEKPFENTLGLTFIFPKKYREHLPKYCNYVITKQDSSLARLIPHENESDQKEFKFDILSDWQSQLYNSYKILSALCYSQISQNGKVPSNVSLFELYNLRKGEIDIASFWEGVEGKRKYDITESLGVPIGLTDSGVTTLDLHEKYDGPHMLIAGTTGSGKSETVISYLLGLCLCYRPDEINLMLVDMKGGGFIKRIGTLPHVVGSVTDVDGDENGTGAVYMLKRFLNALSSEIRRRKILFNSMHVDSITGYIKACRDVNAHINTINNQLKGQNKEPLTAKEEQEIRDQAKNETLSHLILVVDEFTELKRFSTENDDIDFIGEITTIARVGRSLGFHIILISQNIEGAITDDIRVNSKSRLCLKVATRQASKEMIGNDLAASPTMPGNGRAYLLVGTGSKFEYFQSAYSGASVEDNLEAPVEFVEASKNGPYTVFYRSEKDNLELKQRKKELENAGLLETQLNAVVGAVKTYFDQNSDRYVRPHIVFQKPLPDRMYLKDGKIYEFHDGAYEFMKEV